MKGSAERSRAARVSAPSDAPSSHWASSTSITTGASSQITLSTSTSASPDMTPGVATPKRSRHSAQMLPSAATESGDAPALPGADSSPPRTRPATPLHGSAASAGTVCIPATVSPATWARFRISASSRVRPMPGAPSMKQIVATRAFRACSIASSSVPSSSDLATSGSSTLASCSNGAAPSFSAAPRRTRSARARVSAEGSAPISVRIRSAKAS